jgi:hypothetical protein
MKQINETRMRAMLETAINVSGSQKAFAKEAGISEQYLSDVLNGRRDVGEKILKWFGLERVIYFRRIDGGRL